jgi:DNA invertase Pin-like site-specific DNA recombinase
MRRRSPVADAGPTPKRRCAIYTRKSTTHGLDQEFSSLDAQWEACAGYVRGQPGCELVAQRYDDGGFSGASLERPAFQRLMADVEAGKVDVVVVYKIDRLSRSLLDFASLMERFRKAGAYFVSVTQPFLSADSDAMAQLLLNVLMAFAQFERQMIAERIRDKVVASRRKGLWTGGNVPFGYRVEGRKLLPEPTEAQVVQQLLEAYERDGSDCALARELAARKITTRKGQPWTPQAVARVLTNPVYAGYVTMGDELHEGEHEPLIERERFERLQAQRATKEGPGCRREHAQMQRNPAYLLRGLLYCACVRHDGAACGYSMTPSSTRKGSVVHRYYRCIARDKVAVGSCPSRPLVAKDIEGLVREQVFAVARRMKEPGRGGVVRLDAAVVHRSLWIAEQLRGLDQAWDRLLPVNRLRVVHCLVERVDVDSTTGDVRITLKDWVSDALAGRDHDHAA